VQSYGAAPLLAVEDGEKEHLIPLASSICVEIDIASKRIVVDPPEGLLDL
jgi:ribosomal 30S subunit maturation factor RimM